LLIDEIKLKIKEQKKMHEEQKKNDVVDEITDVIDKIEIQSRPVGQRVPSKTQMYDGVQLFEDSKIPL
jgi:hypothetical protein